MDREIKLIIALAVLVLGSMIWTFSALRAESICISEAEHAYILQGHGALEAEALAEYDC